jgi:hypothetical protein
MYTRGLDTYSAAVCELSDACDMLPVRGFDDPIIDCVSAMVAAGIRNQGFRCVMIVGCNTLPMEYVVDEMVVPVPQC